MENSAVKYDVADALTKGLNGVDKGMGFFFLLETILFQFGNTIQVPFSSN